MTGARNAMSRGVTRDESRKSMEINDRVQSVQRTTADISDVIIRAATWLSDQNGTIARPIPALQSRFDLGAKQACDACAMAADIRSRSEVSA